MSYEQLSLSSFIKELKEVTDGAHPRRFCFILGAGASRTSGIKSGQELVKIWDKDLRERNEEEYRRWRKILKITDDNMSSFYSQYYEKRFYRCRTDGYNYIEKIMESAKPSAGYVMLAHLLTQTPHNVVITTNFDHLTEDAVNYYAQNTPLVIGHESLAHYVTAQPVRPTIIKIHHDLLFDPKSSTEDLEKLHNSWKSALGLIFANYHPVFIGYAGNDKSLMDFLVENGEKFANDEWKYPYWMLYKTDKIEGKVKEFLEISDGFFIRHGGFDEVLIQLGATFDYTIPTEENFLEDARKRYRALADAIDALSDNSETPNMIEAASDNVPKTEEAVNETSELDKEENNINQAIEKITSHSEAQRMYRDAISLFNDKKYDEALEINKQLVVLEPQNARYHNQLGRLYHKLGQYENALTTYQKAIELEPEAEAYHYWIAFSLEKMDRYEEALTEYRKAVEFGPDSGMNHYKLAQMLAYKEQYEEALMSIQKAISIDPNYPPFHILLSSIFNGLGRYEEAKSAKKNAEELLAQQAN